MYSLKGPALCKVHVLTKLLYIHNTCCVIYSEQSQVFALICICIMQISSELFTNPIILETSAK